MLAHLQLGSARTIDKTFHDVDLKALQGAVGVSLDRLKPTINVIHSLAVLRNLGCELLLDEPVVGAFRFCSWCWVQQSTYHVPIHWRVAAWAYCPEHMRVMAAFCPGCNAMPISAVSFINAGPKSEGVSSARHCTRCSARLWVETDQTACLTGIEWQRLRYGRATLAALHAGYLMGRETGRREPLSQLLPLIKREVVPRHDERLVARFAAFAIAVA